MNHTGGQYEIHTHTYKPELLLLHHKSEAAGSSSIVLHHGCYLNMNINNMYVYRIVFKSI